MLDLNSFSEVKHHGPHIVGIPSFIVHEPGLGLKSTGMLIPLIDDVLLNFLDFRFVISYSVKFQCSDSVEHGNNFDQNQGKASD